MSTIDSAERLCKRFGPGQLPGAGRRAVGGGYAIATAALSAAIVFVLARGGYAFLTAGPEGFQGLLAPTVTFAYYGLFAVPLVVPAAFLAGVVVWRTLPEGTPYYGPVAGVLATLLTYVVATAIMAVVLFGYLAFAPGAPFEVASAGVLAVVIGVVGFVYTFWVTLPLGAVSGYIHERAVGTE